MLQDQEKKQNPEEKKAQLVQGPAGTRGRATELHPRDRNAMSASPRRRK